MSGTHTKTEIESDGEGEVFRRCEVVPAAEEGKKLRKARKCVSHRLCVRESGRITQTWNESMFDSNIGGFS